jgi:alpha-1,6-mannosyltransferase
MTMRIAHVANFYGPRSGGLRTTMLHLANGYHEQGNQVMIVVPGRRFVIEAQPYGYLLTLPSIRVPFSGGYRLIVGLGRARYMLTSFSPHVLEVSDRTTLIGLGNWARRNGIRTTVFSHETLEGLFHRFLPFSNRLIPLARWWNRRLASVFDEVVATTKFAAREFIEIGVANLRVVPLGVDLDQFSPESFDASLRQKLCEGADTLLVHCGRLSPEKCPERSIEVLRHLVGSGWNARLVIAGDGPTRKKLERSAAGLPVTFLGFVNDRSSLASVLACADVVIAPGPLETFCLAALEALATGTPVVASGSSAVREVLGVDELRHSGGAVAFDSDESFVDAVIRVMAQPEDVRRADSRRRAERYPWWLTVEHMLCSYREKSGLARAS